MKKIAVVEDNPDNRLLVQAILDGTYDLSEYESGRAALAGLRQQPPDLVLLDISLPEMDGPAVLREIRADPTLRALPVIALTAHAMAGDREKYTSMGFDEYVTKPIVDEAVLLRHRATPVPRPTVKVLIADDDASSLLLLERTLQRWGHEVIACQTGTAAAALLTGPAAPQLAILDWMMPGLTGPDVCRQVRARPGTVPPYLILLTAKQGKEHVVTGLDSGADDYIAKPFDPDELHARLNVGQRVLHLQNVLAERVRELEDALTQVKRLQGLVPICSWCKKVRNDRNFWEQVETYFSEHSEARFSHGVCPDCSSKLLANL